MNIGSVPISSTCSVEGPHFPFLPQKTNKHKNRWFVIISGEWKGPPAGVESGRGRPQEPICSFWSRQQAGCPLTPPTRTL